VVGVVEHDFTSALAAVDRSLALSPSSALTYAFSAIIRAWKGDDADAVAHAETALRHSPYDPLIWMPYVGLAYTHFFSGRFEDALGAAVRALRGNPRFSVPAFLQTASLARLRRDTEAAAAGRHLLELQPGFTIASLVDSAFATHLLEQKTDIRIIQALLEPETYCPPTPDRGADLLPVPSPVRRERAHPPGIRLPRC
jgi:tetratricopeptide (TPR) repeat protein